VARGRTPDGQDGPAGIDARARSVESISVLMAKSGVEASLRRHIHAALTEGLISAEEIGEVILHNCIYVGYPATWLALGIAREALDLVDAERPAGEGTKA
jgi:alkylhydroperoxidase/carboxymuconolactone decarboxylase family protein YurZ